MFADVVVLFHLVPDELNDIPAGDGDIKTEKCMTFQRDIRSAGHEGGLPQGSLKKHTW